MPNGSSKVGRMGERTEVELWNKAGSRPTTKDSEMSRLHFQAIFLKVISLFYNCVLQNEATTRRATMTGSTLYRIAVSSSSAINKIGCTRGIREGATALKERVPVLLYCLIAGRRHRATWKRSRRGFVRSWDVFLTRLEIKGEAVQGNDGVR